MPRRTVKVNLSVLTCLDMGHRWQGMEIKRETEGRLRGTARRECLCMVCGGIKIEYFGWDGFIIARTYKTSRDYITEARKLGKVVPHRKAEMRKLILKEIPR